MIIITKWVNKPRWKWDQRKWGPSWTAVGLWKDTMERLTVPRCGFWCFRQSKGKWKTMQYSSCKPCKISIFYTILLQTISALQSLLFADIFALMKMCLGLAIFKAALRAELLVISLSAHQWCFHLCMLIFITHLISYYFLWLKKWSQ